MSYASRLSSEQVNALSKLPSLKGGALSIFVAMLIAQQPLRANELETFTGLANGAITKGLKTLSDLRAVIDLGRAVGWILTPDWQQLPLPLQFLAEGNHGNRDHHGNRDLPVLLVSSSNKYIGKENLTTTTYQGAASNHGNRDFVQPESRPENTAPVESETTALDDPENTEVAYWLSRGAIAPGSPKWVAIWTTNPTAEYVQAHVLQVFWESQDYGRNPGSYPKGRTGTGALIYRLEHRWPVPPMRCEDCLAVVPACLCGVVKR